MLVPVENARLVPGKVAVTVRKSLEEHDPAVIGLFPTSAEVIPTRPPAVPPVVYIQAAELAVCDEAGASRPWRTGEARTVAAVEGGQGR